MPSCEGVRRAARRLRTQEPRVTLTYMNREPNVSIRPLDRDNACFDAAIASGNAVRATGVV